MLVTGLCPSCGLSLDELVLPCRSNEVKLAGDSGRWVCRSGRAGLSGRSGRSSRLGVAGGSEIRLLGSIFGSVKGWDDGFICSVATSMGRAGTSFADETW